MGDSYSSVPVGPQGLRSVQHPLGHKENSIRLTRPSALAQSFHSPAPHSSHSHSVPHTESDRVLTELTEENDYLKSYIKRVENELRIYQLKYPSLSATEQKSIDALTSSSSASDPDVSPPWLANSRYLSPLLVAYEARIEEYQLKIKEKENQEMNLRKDVQDKKRQIAELEGELEKTIGQQIAQPRNEEKQQPSQQYSHEQNRYSPSSSIPANELEEHLQLLQEQNDLLTRSEAELQQMLRTVLANSQQKISELEAKFQVEIRSLKSQLSTVSKERDEWKEKNHLYVEGGKALDHARAELEELEKRHGQEMAKFSKLQKLYTLEKSNHAELQGKHGEMKRDFDIVLKSLESVETRFMENAEKLKQIEEENIALKRESNNWQINQYDAEQREKEWKAQLESVERRWKAEVNAAAAAAESSRQEMIVQHQAIENKLLEEIKSLELSGVELNSVAEAAKRDRAALDARLRMLEKQFEAEREDLHDQVHRLKGEIVEVSGQAKLLQESSERRLTEAQRMKLFYEREFTQYERMNEELKRKGEAAEMEKSALSEAMQQLRKEHAIVENEWKTRIANLEHQLSAARASINEVDQRKSLELTDVRARYERCLGEVERLESESAAFHRDFAELQTQWRDREKSTQRQFRDQIHSAQVEISNLKTEMQQLQHRIRILGAEKESAVAQCQEEELRCQNLQRALEEADLANERSTVQLLAARDQEEFLKAENKSLLARIDRMEIELKKYKNNLEAANKRIKELMQLTISSAEDSFAVTGSAAASATSEQGKLAAPAMKSGGLKGFNQLVDTQLAALHPSKAKATQNLGSLGIGFAAASKRNALQQIENLPVSSGSGPQTAADHEVSSDANAHSS